MLPIRRLPATISLAVMAGLCGCVGPTHTSATRVIFDQNDQNFYPGQSRQLAQYPNPENAIPWGKFAVHIGLKDSADKILPALEPEPPGFENLKTGYYLAPGGVLGLIINADDPRNGHGDISFVMPGVWLSNITMPKEKILQPWRDGFDAIEYSVDMRVPFASSANVYHPHVVDGDEKSAPNPDFAAPYILAGLLFEQLPKPGGLAHPPALWIAVSLFDLRKHYAVEVLIFDNWSGGTGYPIVTTAAARMVAPDDGRPFPDAPPAKPMKLAAPVYSTLVPGSHEFQSVPDNEFHHFAFRITRQNFLTAVKAIKTRFATYSDQGKTPMSTDLSDWGMTYFNLDAEIFHRATQLNPIVPRAMAVEIKNLRVVEAGREQRQGDKAR